MNISMNSNLSISQADLAKLVKAPVVVRVGAFDAGAAKTFTEEFNEARSSAQPIIPIVIDSPGGQVDALLHMLDICRASTKPIATVVLGKAASCAAVLASAGWHGCRYAGPLARFMIHDVSSLTFGKSEELVADAHEGRRLNDLIYGILAENCGQPPRYFWDIVQSRGRADWFLTAQQAQQHQIINHIKVPDLTVSVRATYAFG